MEKIIEKIVQQRSKKGYTIENMAYELNITPAAYRKIETGETRLSVERLKKISAILEEDLSTLLDIETKIVFNNPSDEGNGYAETMNNDYKEIIRDIKEIYDKLIQSKDEQISNLKEQIASLKENK